MSTLKLQPDVLRWARERAGLDVPALAQKMGIAPERVSEWEKTGKLTFAQVDKLAHHSHTAIGYLFLAQPQQDQLSIPDFRTVGDHPVRQPSPDLLETVQAMQQRQNWMRDYLIEEGQTPLPFVRSKTLQGEPEDIASDMFRTLGLARDWADGESNWTNALLQLRRRTEAAGILLFFNGIVGNNTHRTLDPDEFRGFALCDAYAPLIFINGADGKAAQMFTLAHELAHLWIGQDGVSNFSMLASGPDKAEQFCNKVAAEFLVPAATLRNCWPEAEGDIDPWQYLARRFKVSPLVAARRVFDLGLISREAFFAFYRAYQEDERRAHKKNNGRSGGNYWNTQNVRVGERFGRAVIRAAREERLLYRDAFHLIGMSGATFDKFARSLGFDTP
jgi:Zn-dependent peptidase ImmA (M78 family)/transcriptional regulator with XRE-family HTH domain